MEYKTAIVHCLNGIEDEKRLMQIYSIVHHLAGGTMKQNRCSDAYELLRTMSPANVQRVYDYTYRLFLKDSRTEG